MKAVVAEAGYLARYGAVGVISNLALYVVFVALIWIGMSPVLAAGLCYTGGVGLNYLLHRRFTFRSTAVHTADAPRFALAYGTGFVATLVFIALLSRWIRPEIAQILNILLTAGVIYAMLRFLRFGKGNPDSGASDQRVHD